MYDIFTITNQLLSDCTSIYILLSNKFRNIPKSYFHSQLTSMSDVRGRLYLRLIRREQYTLSNTHQWAQDTKVWYHFKWRYNISPSIKNLMLRKTNTKFQIEILQLSQKWMKKFSHTNWNFASRFSIISV